MTEAARNPVPIALGVHAGLFALLTGGLYAAGYPPEVLDETGWWIPYLVVNAGIVVGNLGMGWLANRPDAAEEVVREGRLADLADSRRIVVEQLRNLETEKDKLTPEDYQREREQLLAVGAEAARELDQGPLVAEGDTVPADTPEPSLLPQLRAMQEADPEGFSAALSELGLAEASVGPSGEWRGAAYTLLVVGVCGLMVFMAGQGSRDRAPGMTMTGGDQTIPEGASASRQAPPQAPALGPRCEGSSDVGELNEITEQALGREDLNSAMQCNLRALELAPLDPVARTFKGVLQAFVGKRVEAMSTLNQVLAEHPDTQQAWVYKGLLNLSTDPAASVTAFEAALALQDSPQIRQALAEAQRRLAGGAAPPPRPAPSAAPPGGGGEPLVSGRITLADGASSEGTALFVNVRPAGQTAGPPMAALKLAPGPFPMDFALTTANILPMFRGRPLPEALTVGVRLDADGDAMSRLDTEPQAAMESVSVGSADLAVTLE